MKETEGEREGTHLEVMEGTRSLTGTCFQQEKEQNVLEPRAPTCLRNLALYSSPTPRLMVRTLCRVPPLTELRV